MRKKRSTLWMWPDTHRRFKKNKDHMRASLERDREVTSDEALNNFMQDYESKHNLHGNSN